MIRPLLAGLLAAAFGVSSAAADRSAALDVARDEILDRAYVPSAERPQGEVRVVRRGGHAVVQTLLYTRVLKRVFGAIAEKERRNWPADARGRDDAERYLGALDEFQRAHGRPAEGDRRTVVLIEYVDAPPAPFVAVGEVDIAGTGGDVRIRGRSSPVVLDLSAAYVRRNMELIVADSFGVPEAEARARLARARTP